MTNNYLLQGFKGKNRWWRYLVMILVLVVATVIGSFPYTIAILIKSSSMGIQVDASDVSSINILGLNKNLMLFMLTLSFVAALFAFILFLKPLHERNIADTLTSRKKFDFKRFFFAAGIWGGLMIISLIVGYLTNPDNYTLQFDASQFIILFFVAIIFITMQATFEEVIFRGYFQQGLAVLTKNAWIPIILTSFVFGLMHMSNPEVKEFGVAIMLPQYILLGLIFAICVIMDEGLEIAIGVHVVNNVLGSLLLTHDSSVLQTSALFKVEKIDPIYSFYELIVSLLILIFIMAYKYKWGSFKKLFAKLKPETISVED